MRWRGGRQSGNIEDRRGMGPVGAVGGLGLGGVVVVLIGVFVFGVDPAEMMNVVEQGAPASQSQQAGQRGETADDEGRFVGAVETSTTDVWSQIFQQSGKRYEPAAGVVLYDGATPTACGQGQAAMGPFYCPGDRKVYLDLAFWHELETRFGARGDFARAYVIAHEIGHHVQNLTGELNGPRGMSAKGASGAQVRVELQADCYAGVWAARTRTASGGEVALEDGDIEEGLGAASAVGDDTIQRRTQGRVVPDAFTHGTAEQRMRWFKRGYETGDPGRCDTAGARSL
ncbi:MAG: neutral zinc metallopeptidase [Caulobacter sp.]|nr:neutral zinc metallopeptidase [Caulobacter sp.]